MSFEGNRGRAPPDARSAQSHHPNITTPSFSPQHDTAPSQLPPTQAEILSFREFRNPAGALWVAMPARQRRGPDDQVALDEWGRPIYDAVIEFRDRAARDRFNALLLAALRHQHPEAFAGAVA